MDLAPPTTTRGVELDSPPPRPPSAEKKDLLQLSMKPPGPEGLGEMANNPTIMAMQGLAMAKQGFQLLANGIPAISQLLMNTINDLEQIVPQAMADSIAGTQPQMAPPGVAPPMGPPPPGMGPQGPPGPPGGPAPMQGGPPISPRGGTPVGM